MTLTRLSRVTIIAVRLLIDDNTPAKINLSVRKTKYPPARAAAMGNPTSDMSVNTFSIIASRNPLL
jgi:hypothetical protein